MDWRVKGIVQKGLSMLPRGNAMNDVLQNALGGRGRVEREARDKVVDDFTVLSDLLVAVGAHAKGKVFLEIGSGWYPTMPVCFSLLGAERCETFDLTRHMNERRALRMVRVVGEHLATIAEHGKTSLDEVRVAHGRLARCRTLAELLTEARVRYHAPADATETKLPSDSIDVVYSNTVLEHVGADILPKMFVEMARVLRPGGLAVHSVNCGDHYAFFDRSISQINYLQFTEAEWRLWNNDLQHQNRLRPSDFLKMAKAAGLEVVHSVVPDKPEHRALLRTLRLAPEFARYDETDIIGTSLDFVARKPG